MNNNDQPFFDSLSYSTYQKISKQMACALFLFVSIALIVVLISALLFYQWNTIQSEKGPLLEQQEQLTKIMSQKKRTH